MSVNHGKDTTAYILNLCKLTVDTLATRGMDIQIARFSLYKEKISETLAHIETRRDSKCFYALTPAMTICMVGTKYCL